MAKSYKFVVLGECNGKASLFMFISCITIFSSYLDIFLLEFQFPKWSMQSLPNDNQSGYLLILNLLTL